MVNPIMLDSSKDIFESNIESCESSSGSQGMFLDCNVKIVIFIIKSVVEFW